MLAKMYPLGAETSGAVFQEVIRPFSAHVAALNADRTRTPVSRCTPLTSQVARPQPGRVAGVASHRGADTAQPEEAAQQQRWKPPGSLNRLQESTGAAAAAGVAAEAASAAASEAAASAEPSALDKDRVHPQQQPLQQHKPPGPPTLASAYAMLPTGAPSHGHLENGLKEWLLMALARNSPRQGVSRKLRAAQSPVQHDTKASASSHA